MVELEKRDRNLWVVETESETDTRLEGRSPRVVRMPLGWLTLLGLVSIASLTVWLGLTYGHRPTGSVPAVAQASTVQPTSHQQGKATGALASSTSATAIEVDVHGDVRHAGVVSVPQSARVRNAIQAAGGFRHPADAMNVNQAALVWDGEEIDIPSSSQPLGSTPTSSLGVGSAAPTSALTANSVRVVSSGIQGRIDINTADVVTLETLPGVGPKRAAEIIQYRVTHGPFRQLTDLAKIRGIGPKSIAKWTGLLFLGGTLSGTTSAQR